MLLVKTSNVLTSTVRFLFNSNFRDRMIGSLHRTVTVLLDGREITTWDTTCKKLSPLFSHSWCYNPRRVGYSCAADVMSPIRRISPTLNMTVFSALLFWQQIPYSKKMNLPTIFFVTIFSPAKDRMFCFDLATSFTPKLLRSKIVPTSRRSYKRRLLSSDIIFFHVSDPALKLFNSVCPHFPSPFTPIMWLTPTKRIDRRESCGSLRMYWLRHGSE